MSHGINQAHIRNLMGPRESLDLIKTRYYKNALWSAAIQHASSLHAAWRSSTLLPAAHPLILGSEAPAIGIEVAKGEGSAEHEETKMQLTWAQERFRLSQKMAVAAAVAAKRKGFQGTRKQGTLAIPGDEDASSYLQTKWPIQE
jgi:hypothetical protein